MLANPLIPILRSFDEAKAAEFYQGFLGFMQDWMHRFEPGLALYQQISLQRPDGVRCVLHLSEHHGDACPGGAVRIEWFDVPAMHQRLLSHNYGFARPGLETMPWGMRELQVKDPFGNRLVFFEDISEG